MYILGKAYCVEFSPWELVVLFGGGTFMGSLLVALTPGGWMGPTQAEAFPIANLRGTTNSPSQHSQHSLRVGLCGGPFWGMPTGIMLFQGKNISIFCIVRFF